MLDPNAASSEIRAHIAAGRLVVLTGAGASAGPPRQLPDWSGMVSQMIARVAPVSAKRAALMEELRDQRNLIGAASLFAQHGGLPKADRQRFFVEQFATETSDTTQLTEAVAGLQVRHWLTTNYDELLSRALHRRNVAVYGNSASDLSSAISLWSVRPSLIHLHGQAHLYDSIVYSDETYNRISSQDTYVHLLRDVFIRHSVLAIGFGWTDPPFLETLRHIRDKMSGAGRHPHYAILPSTTTADLELLRSANFCLVQYDASGGHSFVQQFVGNLRAAAPTELANGVSKSAIHDLETLASVYAAITDPNRRNTYQIAAGTLVLTELRAQPRTRPELISCVATRLGTTNADSGKLVDCGLDYLEPLGAVRVVGERLAVQLEFPELRPAITDPVVDAILVRMTSHDRGVAVTERLRASVRHVVAYAMLAQGKAVARAFANEDDPDAYVLHKLVDSGVSQSDCPIGQRRALAIACREILIEPSPEVSRVLFDLATAAYALERVFLNPVDSNVGEALRWRLYLDSNVAMRMLDSSSDLNGSLRTLRVRCERLGTPLHVLGPFLDEIVAHVEIVGRLIAGLHVRSLQGLERYMKAIPRQELSPILLWYARGMAQGLWKSYEGFLSKSGLGTMEGAARTFAKLGIHIEGHNAVARMDTSVRETLWAELRSWRRHDQESQGARRLRRAEATQVVWLSHIRKEGYRGWFLSRDGQLRRALKFVLSGEYSGYVITPSAWMMRLRELNWGDLDMQGFAELMWIVPQQGPVESLKKLAMARVLEQEPDLAGRNPDWLRDEIEVRFERCGSLIEAAADVSGPDEELHVAESLARQIVDPTVEELLDQLARARQQQQRE